MELRQYVNILIKWWWLMLVSVVLAGVSSYLGTRAMPHTYLSRTTLMVGQALQSPNPSQSEFSTGQALAQSYIDLARREPVLKATLVALKLPWDWTALQQMVSSRLVPGTQLLEIAVLDTDPQRAKVLADQVAHQLILQSPAAADTQQEAERQFIQSQIGELKTNISKSQEDIRQLDDQISKATSARQIQDARSRQAALQTQVSSWQATYAQLLTSLQRGAPNSLSVVEPAQVPAGPIGPRVGYNVLLAAAIGLVLAGSAAFLLEYIDDTLKTADDVHRALNLTILGRLTRIEGEGYPSKLVVIQRPRSSGAEAFRVLRTNLRLSAKDRPLHTLMVTSSNPQEGKSVTAANLAVALAQSGKQVILVDADLRHPTQHNIFGLNNDVGLTTLLLEEDANLTETLQTVSVTNLSVLPSGPLPDNPAELLGSKRMRDLIESLQQHADIVIFDSPPVMAVADTTILAVRLDGALLVVDSGKTRRTIAQRSKETLASVGARLVGVALNRMPARDGYYYSHYYTEDGQRIQRRTGQDPLAPSLRRNGDAASRMDGTPAKREGPTDTKPLPEESS